MDAIKRLYQTTLNANESNYQRLDAGGILDLIPARLAASIERDYWTRREINETLLDANS